MITKRLPDRQSKFYGIRMVNCTYCMLGGVSIDERGRVLDAEQRPIGGLYAAGDTAAGSVYGPYTPNVTSISTIAYSFGMICADDIAERLKEGIKEIRRHQK